MSDDVTFAAIFPGGAAPEALGKLFDFQREAGFEAYADGFGLLAMDKGALSSWSSDPAFAARLTPFAQASGGGSFYALWAPEGVTDPARMPVIVFGDEGGIHVVAEDVRALLGLIGFDVEPSVDFDGVSFYKDQDRYQPRRQRAAYVDFLRRELGLEPVDDPASVVAAAQAAHLSAFEAWKRGFGG
jgi:hypothetical protein